MATPKKQEPLFTDEEQQHLDWFNDLDPKHFLYLTNQWNELKLGTTLKKKKNYDDWLNYFSTLTASQVRMLVTTGQDILTAEGYSALRRWADIITHPGRIDKIHQSGLVGKGKKKNSVLSLAQDNDRLGVLKATRDKIAEKLDKGAGNRDTALLTAQITEIMIQIADQEKRLGPKADTPLGALFADMPETIAGKREKNAGSRNTSYRAKVTIDDLNQSTEEAE